MRYERMGGGSGALCGMVRPGWVGSRSQEKVRGVGQDGVRLLDRWRRDGRGERGKEGMSNAQVVTAANVLHFRAAEPLGREGRE